MNRLKTGMLSCLFAISPSLMADQYHYGNLLVGGRAIGYGGAFIAVADDQSAMYYNPAGLSFQSGAKSASVNTMAFERTRFEQVYSNGDDFERASFAVVPGFLGISTELENWHIGSYFTVTDFSQERVDSRSDYTLPASDVSAQQQVTESVVYDFDNAAYRLGGVAAYKINSTFSLGFGLNLQYAETVLNQSSGAAIVIDSPLGEIYTGFDARRRITEKQFFISPQLSVLYKENGWRLGASATYTASLNRSYRSNSVIVAPMVTLLTGSPNTTFRDEINTDKDQKQPLKLSAGAAYESNGWLITGQVNYFTKVDLANKTTDSVPLNRELKQVTNYALGVKIPVSNTSAVTFGVFTDNSNSVIDLTQPFQREEAIDTTGVSVAFETHIMSYPLTIGMYAKHGSGQVRYADVRYVEAVTGLSLYPENDSFDVKPASKRSFVLFASMDF